jgi:hypothetical protein
MTPRTTFHTHSSSRDLLPFYHSKDRNICHIESLDHDRADGPRFTMDLWKILNSTETNPAHRFVRPLSPPSYIRSASTELGSAPITDDAEAISACSSHVGGADSDTAMLESAPCASPASFATRPKSSADVINEVTGSTSGFSVAGDEAEGVQAGEEVQAPVPVLVPRSGASSVIAAIETMIGTIVKSLLANQGPCMILKTKKRSDTSSEAADGQDIGLNQVKFLGPSQQEAWRFSKRFLMHCRHSKS